MFIIKKLYELLETITDYALKEMYDEQELKKKLMELALLYEMGEIEEDRFNELEQMLLKQLREAREYHRAQSEEEEEDMEEEDNAGMDKEIEETEENPGPTGNQEE